MNRVAIKLNKFGELDGVASDEPIEFFIFDPNCKSEPVYQWSFTEYGPHTVRDIIKDHPIGYGCENILVDYKGSRPTLKTVKD